MKLWAVAVGALGIAGFAGAALADCDDAPGDRAVIAVPKGKAVRVMYLRPGEENNHVEVCSRVAPPGKWVMEHGEFANATDWYLFWEVAPEAADYQLNVMGLHFGPSDDLVPWKGMRRTAMPWGVRLDWYETDPAKPNTIVEICLHDGKGTGCPVHQTP